MQIPHNATVAVVDGKFCKLFRNSGSEAEPKLAALPHDVIDADHKGADAGHGSSAANPDDRQGEEDGFAVGAAALLNRLALDGKMTDLVVIAAPRTLGELRKHYHKTLSAMLQGEIAKDLTGHTMHDIEKAIAAHQ